jgi:hypothetical protein
MKITMLNRQLIYKLDIVHRYGQNLSPISCASPHGQERIANMPKTTEVTPEFRQFVK